MSKHFKLNLLCSTEDTSAIRQEKNLQGDVEGVGKRETVLLQALTVFLLFSTLICHPWTPIHPPLPMLDQLELMLNTEIGLKIGLPTTTQKTVPFVEVIAEHDDRAEQA